MQTALEVHNSLAIEAKQKNHQQTRVIPKMKVKQAIRQGDVYVTKISKLPSDLVETKNLQIVTGDTKGSRHILVETESLKVYNLSKPGPLDGPIIESKEKIHLTHPEHAHFILPAGIYSTHYQQDYQASELAQIRAVRD